MERGRLWPGAVGPRYWRRRVPCNRVSYAPSGHPLGCPGSARAAPAAGPSIRARLSRISGRILGMDERMYEQTEDYNRILGRQASVSL
jgi:hypothetical protein